ncbi:RdgB/HAM1 family non-canonical purine NTP pyrophosphatase [Alicyclobacillus fodiniaquatilis]|jgi:XTP/dITP diphosphohydrolase|uniref:dITP/XTP pyrophosphatase n=1 Tax=Alicyclobacillus fodiniaquatilis TaxID=1661150 RepID=A0ABW4JGE6_9BACL
MPKVVIATHNRHKAEEFRHLLQVPDLDLDFLPDEIAESPETGVTFVANAEQKALFYSKLLPDLVLADDSGVRVPLLNGEPGVYSARYAGRHGDDKANNDKLIARLHECGVKSAVAEFVCALSLCCRGEVLLTVEGVVQGTIKDTVHGQAGFGYDPLFVPEGSTLTFGEMTPAEKAAYSHRARAVHRLVEGWKGIVSL